MTVFTDNPYGGEVNGGVAQLELKGLNVSNLTTYMDIFITANKAEDESKSHELHKGDLLVKNLNITNNMSAIYVWAIPEHNNTQVVILGRKDCKPTLQEYEFRQTVPNGPKSPNVSVANNSSDSSVSDHGRFLMFIENDDLNQSAAGLWHFGFYYNGSVREDDQENAPESASFNISIVQLTCKYLNTTSGDWKYDGCKVRAILWPY